MAGGSEGPRQSQRYSIQQDINCQEISQQGSVVAVIRLIKHSGLPLAPQALGRYRHNIQLFLHLIQLGGRREQEVQGTATP